MPLLLLDFLLIQLSTSGRVRDYGLFEFLHQVLTTDCRVTTLLPAENELHYPLIPIRIGVYPLRVSKRSLRHSHSISRGRNTGVSRFGHSLRAMLSDFRALLCLLDLEPPNLRNQA